MQEDLNKTTDQAVQKDSLNVTDSPAKGVESQKKELHPKSQHRLMLSMVGLILVVAIVVLLSIVIVHIHDHNKQSKTTSSALAPSPLQASITNSGFFPATIQVKIGQAVTWTNYDSADHTVSSDPYPTDNGLAGFKSSILGPNQTYSYIFSKSGTFGYHDNLNPYTFKGVIIVK